uniref:Oligoribonuclease, mitochondrial n=3 Tax=Canis lupus TaxID=9612 RepID=A0A8C0MSH1_CANLF
MLGLVVWAPAPPRGFATFSDHRACARARAGWEAARLRGWGRGGSRRVMLGGSLGSRLLRGVGGSRGRFGSRGVREGGAAMAAGESMAQRMVWVDLEMTGLDIEKDQIIEMACLITDSDLNILAEGPNLIIKQPDELLDSMSDWCKEHHGKSGLTKAVKESTMTLQQAEYEFLSFVRQQTPPGLCPLAGNSVHADKKFLDKYMPQFMKHLHYRIIDVSTVKELCRALDDISESIKELQFYRNNIFKKKTDEKKRKIIENGENEKTVS